MIVQKRNLGQNFLINKKYVKGAVSALQISDNDAILEIGPGQGAITGYVMQKILRENIQGINYTAIELDIDLIENLNQNFRTNILKFKVIQGNFLDLNLSELAFNKIIGAIPYYITSPIIHKLVHESLFENCVLIVQKEFAEKIVWKNSKLTYWSLFLINYDVEIIEYVPRNAFKPAPKVDSAIIRLKPKQQKVVKNTQDWSKFLHRLFLTPRKMLNKRFDKQELLAVDISPNLRSSQLDLKSVLDLYKAIKSN